MIPVVTNETMLRDRMGSWNGLVGFNVGHNLYVDLTAPIDSPEFNRGCDRLAARIKFVRDGRDNNPASPVSGYYHVETAESAEARNASIQADEQVRVCVPRYSLHRIENGF